MMNTYAAEEFKAEVLEKLRAGEFVRLDDAATSYLDWDKIEAKLSEDGLVTISAPYALGASKVCEFLA